MKAFIVVFVLFNIMTFIVFGYDKLMAYTQKERIREKTLLILALMGGSVGAIFAQKIFRHKTKKFKNRFWLILIGQFVIFELAWLYWSGYYKILFN